ncbi:MAG: hypothetical protein E7Z97_01220 [Propionibacteriaceae bacterium]|nr:hypothetical protein [Propionibacteriaceae bacterium]
MTVPSPNDHGNRFRSTARPAAPLSRSRVGVLRGIRAGALLAIVALAVLAVWFTPYGTEDRITPLMAAALYLPATSITLLLTVLLTRELHNETFAQRAVGAVLLAVQWAGCALVYYFITVCLIAPGAFLGHPVAVGVTCLGAGFLITTDTLLRTHPTRHRGGPHDIARWRPLTSQDTSHAMTALTGLVTLALALAVALAPARAARPERQLAPEPSEIPAVPTTVAGEPAWTLDLDEDDGAVTVAAGAAGPILVTGSEIRGLDPADGSTRWAYNSPNAQLLDLPAPSPGLATRIITGPDRRYAAFATLASGSTRPWEDPAYAERKVVVTVLDTLTGRVAVERTLAEQVPATTTMVPTGRPIQLTDTAALIGTEAIDLTTATTLWTLPEQETTSSDPSAYVGPAGHSTFVLRDDPESDMTTSLVLLPQNDPDRRTHLSKVATSADRPLIIDGWTVGYTDEPSYAEGGHAAAVNLDEMAEKHEPGSTQSIPLGQTVGPDLAMSRTSLIATAPPTANDPVPRPATVFDPATRTATPIGLSAAIDVTTVTADSDTDDDAVLLRLAATNGSATSEVRITGATRYGGLDYRNRDNEPGDRFSGVSLIAVPGAVLVWAQSYSECCSQIQALRHA